MFLNYAMSEERDKIPQRDLQARIKRKRPTVSIAKANYLQQTNKRSRFTKNREAYISEIYIVERTLHRVTSSNWHHQDVRGRCRTRCDSRCFWVVNPASQNSQTNGRGWAWANMCWKEKLINWWDDYISLIVSIPVGVSLWHWKIFHKVRRGKRRRRRWLRWKNSRRWDCRGVAAWLLRWWCDGRRSGAE
jgi:hypothetical protein